MTEARKCSLGRQIAALELEIEQRKISRGKMSRSESEYQLARLEAARVTLIWLQDNEAKIKQVLGARNEPG
jgi:hypothetical protein